MYDETEVEICVLKALEAVATTDLLLELEFIKNKPLKKVLKLMM